MNSIKNFIIAMEAEDLTEATQQDAQKLVGGNESPDNPKKGSVTDTNIFGDNSSSSNPDNDKTKPEDTGTDSGEDTPQDDTSGDDSLDMGGEDNPEGGDTPPDMSMSENDIPEMDQSEYKLKNTLRENMIMLHSIIANNIESLSVVSNEATDLNDNKILYKISSNLADCKDILYKEITEGFNTKSYENLIKTYVAINRVYDLCIEMLNKYYSDLDNKK